MHIFWFVKESQPYIFPSANLTSHFKMQSDSNNKL